MLIGHHHAPGLFDAGHCRACARQAGPLDHYDRVQQQEAQLWQAGEWARAARGTPSGRWGPPASPSCWPSSPC
jgi:hypothetical protein